MYESKLNALSYPTREKFKPKIMAVDDEAINLLLLEDIIEDRYHLTPINNGDQCLESVLKVLPDLILLDINMPGLSGFEVCEKLKSNPKTREIPIIFLTALLGVDDERRGLQMGAVDFITKPFTESILLARIDTQLSLFQAKKQIEENNRTLKKEQEYIEQIITSMRQDRRYEDNNIRQVLTPLEISNGDIVLSASNENLDQHIMVGDFTGHGLTAAIAGPLVTSLFYSNVKNGFSPNDVLQMINYELFHKLPVQKFLAVTYVEWQKQAKTISIYNHGMPAVALFKKQHPETPIIIESSRLPLGIIEDIDKFSGSTVSFQEGDRLVVFTDGLVDPRNHQQRFVDEQSFIAFIQNKMIEMQTVDYVLDEMLDELNQINGADDLTVIEIKACYSIEDQYPA